MLHKPILFCHGNMKILSLLYTKVIEKNEFSLVFLGFTFDVGVTYDMRVLHSNMKGIQ